MKCSPFLHSLPRRSPLALCLAVALVGAASASNKTPAANSAHPAFDAPFKAGAPHAAVPHVTTGTLIPVTNCADDGSDGSLRKVIEGAADGDTVDMSGLQCSLITLQSGCARQRRPQSFDTGSRHRCGDHRRQQRRSCSRRAESQYFRRDVCAWHRARRRRRRLRARKWRSVANACTTHGLHRRQRGRCHRRRRGRARKFDHAGELDRCEQGQRLGKSRPVAARSSVEWRRSMTSAVSGNSAEASQDMVYGGGLFGTGTIKLFASTFDSNIAHSQQGRAFGGAIMAAGGVAVHGSIVSNNTAKAAANAVYGGGIHAKGAYPVSILDGSTITGNTAHSDVSWAYGGGISSGTVTAADQVDSHHCPKHDQWKHRRFRLRLVLRARRRRPCDRFDRFNVLDIQRQPRHLHEPDLHMQRRRRRNGRLWRTDDEQDHAAERDRLRQQCGRRRAGSRYRRRCQRRQRQSARRSTTRRLPSITPVDSGGGFAALPPFAIDSDPDRA